MTIPASRLTALVLLLSLLMPGVDLERPARAQGPAPLRVRLEAGRGPFYAGQVIDLRVSVAARDQRPTLELPTLSNADLWNVETSFTPLSATGIGDVVSGANLFLTRLRLLPRRAGSLEIPPIVARLDERMGRSQALRLSIEPVPLEGRTAGFLGGVGDFALRATVEPSTVAAGQEFLYRIEVSGPAALGMTARPELDRLGRLPIAPRIEPLPDQESREPPSRTFTWRIRPSRPGSAVLPPVTVSSFDPARRRFITRASQGTPVQVVAVPRIGTEAVDYSADEGPQSRRVWAWFLTVSLLTLLALALRLGRAAWRRRREPRSGPAAARRFARVAAGRWKITNEVAEGEQARTILADLVTYARIGVGRPPGALTPVEASELVRGLTGSLELANRAAVLCEHCDRLLFSQRSVDGRGLIGLRANELFEALGRANPPAADSGVLSETTGRTSD